MQLMNPPRKLPPGAPERVRTLAAMIVAEARRRFGHGIRAYWFGSWVSGGARAHSDIDLALLGPEPLPHRELAALRDWIDDLPTLYSIDLLDLSQVGESMHRRVESGGTPL